ncbi:MAG: serine--tRNA ligase [Chloroflexi bacterium]|nr:serine--tRNA ligase [Chloroflexota bacterium]
MLSIRTIREQTEELRDVFARRGVEAPLDAIVELDRSRRELLTEVESMRADRNQAGRRIGQTRDPEERQRLIDEQRAVADRLDALEERLREQEAELRERSLELPNTLHEDVQDGGEEAGEVILEGVGAAEPVRVEPPVVVGDATEPAPGDGGRPHWEIGEELGLIDFERGAKIAGSRFYVLRGQAARLQRALIAWMLDLHSERGFDEVYVPFVVKEEMLVGTGQLPKFGETMYHDAEDDVWLVPTAEVPVTNLYRDEILDGDALPIRHVAYTPCFRRERMSAGRDIRGIKRGHQFDKVEIVIFSEPDRSWDEHDLLLNEALEVARQLGLTYRVVRLAAADVTQSSAMTYDIEVWAPGSGEWLEVSSVSNFLDYQARRANLRYRDGEGRVQHMHTLNGSGIALPRTLAAVLEQYDRGEHIEVPEVLRPYLGGVEQIEAETVPS